MFREIIPLIEAKEYSVATHKLLPIYRGEDDHAAAKAAYLLGYINTRHDNDERNDYLARQYLRDNMNSNDDIEYAYILYSRIEDDKNIAFNYLKQGVEHFPTNPRLLTAFFRLSPEKEMAIQRIHLSKVMDAELLGVIVEYLAKKSQWDRVEQYITLIQEHNNLHDQEQTYLQLIFAYALLFKPEPDYQKAASIFSSIIDGDIDNCFAYSHYLGRIYALLNLGLNQKVIELFDRIPVNNSICDLDDGPQPLGIFLSFEKIYQIIFEKLVLLFAHDKIRKYKAQALYVLYLYHPSELCDVCRYKKSDALILERYIKIDFNPCVATVLYHMRWHFQQYCLAYDVIWEFLRNQQKLEDSIALSDLLSGASPKEINTISEMTVENMDQYDYSKSSFMTNIFNSLVDCLFRCKMYGEINLISQKLTDSEILESNRAFECAYSFAEKQDNRAERIYEGLIQKNPNDTSSLNNLGVLYEQKGNWAQALKCYEKAHSIQPQKEVYENNLSRVNDHIEIENRKEIDEIASQLTIEALNEIGYTNNLKRKIAMIQDPAMRNILSRDLFECAIAVVTRQDKMATIMCGSISEALLMLCINEKGFTKYDIRELTPSRTSAENFPVSEMGMNELLFVASKIKLLQKNSYHLGHYIRDYRNVVHPAKEIRMKESITHENVLTMWSVLNRLIYDLLED